MIRERLRPIFAKERWPLLLGHLALALALVPIPMIRTGMAEFGAFMALFPFQAPPWIGLGILAAGVLFSFPLVPLFLAWSLPGAALPGLPRRSIGLLCLLVATHPLRFFFEGAYHRIEIRAKAESLSEKFPAVWAIKHLDTPLLLGLVVWAILQHQTMRAHGKLWFHWALFVCVLCAAFAPFDTQFGFLFTLRFE
jgi:hypothetical protein